MLVRAGDIAPEFVLPAADRDGDVALRDDLGRSQDFLGLFPGFYCVFCRRAVAGLGRLNTKLVPLGIQTLGVVATPARHARASNIILFRSPSRLTHPWRHMRRMACRRYAHGINSRFLIDHTGMVRWAFVEAADGPAGLGMFPPEDELVLADRPAHVQALTVPPWAGRPCVEAETMRLVPRAQLLGRVDGDHARRGHLGQPFAIRPTELQRAVRYEQASGGRLPVSRKLGDLIAKTIDLGPIDVSVRALCLHRESPFSPGATLHLDFATSWAPSGHTDPRRTTIAPSRGHDHALAAKSAAYAWCYKGVLTAKQRHSSKPVKRKER